MLYIVYEINDGLFLVLKGILISISVQAVLSYIIKPVQVVAITFKESSARKPRFSFWCLLLNDQVIENRLLSVRRENNPDHRWSPWWSAHSMQTNNSRKPWPFPPITQLIFFPGLLFTAEKQQIWISFLGKNVWLCSTTYWCPKK